MDPLIEDQKHINSKLHISTMSTTCKIGHSIINIENIYNYLPVSYDNVLLINYKNTYKTVDESLIKKRKKKTKKIVKKVNNFFNQITLLMAIDENKKINTKLFTNGSVQMTGSKSIADNLIILNKLIECLKKTYYADGKEIKLVENPELLEVTFDNEHEYEVPEHEYEVPEYEHKVSETLNLVENMESLKITDNYEHEHEHEHKVPDRETIKLVENPELLEITNFKISMINTNFGIGKEVNREDILKVIKEDNLPNIKAKLKPDIHAAVNIELLVQESIVTILVFKTGNIIITGGKNSLHINTAYEYINKLIDDNKSRIIKNYVESC
jgi:TATA-box binding protein (TBP) (component of TFIID and TFIIIB)